MTLMGRIDVAFDLPRRISLKSISPSEEIQSKIAARVVLSAAICDDIQRFLTIYGLCST